MKFSVVRVGELGPAEKARWDELQASNPGLASPFFSWRFVEAAASAMESVRVAVLEQDHRVVGFFPYQQRFGAGLPAGGRLSDHHGVIASRETSWNWQDLLKACRLSFWHFDHLPAWQRPHAEVVQTVSPGLDLSRGFDRYWRGRLAQGHTLQGLPRKRSKLERELGPLRFEAHSRDRKVFDTVIRLKREQCRRTGELDFFAWPWTQALVERIRDADEPGFAGRLSALYAGDTLLAAHFGMRSATVWHWWFPVYCREHGRYSPGLLLLVQLAEAAARQGHSLLDLGMGDEPYKASFADTASPLLAGIVTRPTFLTAARALKKGAGRWLRSSPVAQPLRPLLHGYRLVARNLGVQ